MEESDIDTQENDEISEFQSLISQAQNHIQNIEKQIGQLIPIKGRIIDTTDEEEQEISKKLNNIINNVNNSKIKMDNIIKNLKPQLILDEQKPDEVDIRIKKNLFDAMIKKYQNTLQRFQEEENEIKRIKETKLVRGAEIALGQELDEQERKELIENPQILQQIYEDKLKQKAHVKLINAVQDLEERHKDIKNLEKSVLQMHKMIMELNLLVQYQGEMIDNIAININKAKDYVIKAEGEIIKGKKNMERTKKIKCIIMIVIIAVLLIIIIPILIRFL